MARGPALDEGLKQYLLQGKPLSVKVTIVNGTRVCCPGCKLGFDPRTEKPVMARADPPAPAPPPSQSFASEVGKPNATLSASAPANVVPLPERPRNPSMAKFNTIRGYSVAKDGGLAKGPATGRIDRLAEPNPAREAAHPLPSPPPECFK